MLNVTVLASMGVQVNHVPANLKAGCPNRGSVLVGVPFERRRHRCTDLSRPVPSEHVEVAGLCVRVPIGGCRFSAVEAWAPLPERRSRRLSQVQQMFVPFPPTRCATAAYSDPSADLVGPDPSVPKLQFQIEMRGLWLGVLRVRVGKLEC